MSNTTIVLGAIFVIALLCVFSVIGIYNGMVAKDVNVANQWGKVQSAYQRRADLIPNLVATVNGSKNFEQQTQVQIAEMRSQAGQVQTQVAQAQSPEELQAAQTSMSGILARLMVVVEAYPDLKSTANFLALQDELTGTENRIKYERDNYNDAVKDYQTNIRSVPTVMFAGMFGFSADKYKMFQASQEAQNATKVQF